MSAAPTRAERMREALAERRAAHLQRGRIYRLLFVIAGASVTLAGLAMMVLPGPALVVIPIGLAMLALEFAWAERLLEIAVDRAEAAGKTVKETSARQRVAGAIAIAAIAGAAVAAALLWDIPLLPV